MWGYTAKMVQKAKKTGFSKMLVMIYQTTHSHVSKDSNLYTCICSYYFLQSLPHNFLYKVTYTTTEFTHTVMEAPAAFIAVELWHTMYYLMLWQAKQWWELLHANFALDHIWTTVQSSHCVRSEAFLTLLTNMGIHMLVHMLPVCNKLWDGNVAKGASSPATRLQLFPLKPTKFLVMRFLFSSQYLSN
jgi:hypothetical protein